MAAGGHCEPALVEERIVVPVPMNKMNPKEILLLGCGDIGTELGLRLQRKGNTVAALCRNPGKLPASLEPVAADYTDPEQLAPLHDRVFDIAVMTPTPATFDEAGYRAGFLVPVENLLQLWSDGPRRSLVFVSSTRVYGDHGGDWVTESSELHPADAQARCIAEAEARLLDSRHDVTVVRFAGIYGRQPSALLRRLAAGEVCAAAPARYSNRIHREDCIGFLEHLLSLSRRQSLYLAADSEPVLQRELEDWLLAQLGVAARCEVPVRGTANRRCDNSRLLDSGYRLRYPDFRAGYSAMMTSTSISADLGNAAT